MKNKLKSFNTWVNESYLSADKADDYAKSSGIDIKKVEGNDNSELSSGGKVQSELIDVVKELEKITGFQLTITSGNDIFHKDHPTSNHNKGDAVDITFKEATDITSRKKMEKALLDLMVSGKYDTNGNRLGGINEYDNPTKHATGGHFHLSLTSDKESRDKYETNLALSGITSYSQIRELKKSGTSDIQSDDTTDSSKYSQPEFKMFFRKLFKRILAKYDDSINGYQIYNKKGTEQLGKVIMKDNKIYFINLDNIEDDITNTSDGESFNKAFSLKSDNKPLTTDIPAIIQPILSGQILLKVGSTGPDVTEIQQKLSDEGYIVHITGTYDEITKGVVQKYQTDNNLLVDGIVGPITSSTLYGVKNNATNMANKNTGGSGIIAKADTSFDKVVETVIDKLEGGYYHPDMLKDGRVKDSRYSSSGETMMGIDRVAGGALNDTPAGKEFWKLIDDANARSTWKWLYRGGALEPQLRRLAGQIIKPQFEKLVASYLTPEAKNLVYSDGRLLFHFIYATWNGAGWFRKFATDINQAVTSGIVDTNSLVNVAMQSRTSEGLKPGSAPNSLIAQGGEKIKNIVGVA